MPDVAADADRTTDPLDAAAHRAVAVSLYNHTWTLIETTDRTPDQVDAMIHAAHASRYHWSLAEGAETINLGRGEWLCSRVYAVLGRPEPAMWHARRCLDYAEAGGPGSEDWDVAAAYEAIARAWLTAGDREQAADWKARALAALGGVADEDDRGPIADDLESLP